MALQITGQPQGISTQSFKSGPPATVNMGWQNELLKSDLFPRYAYLVLAGLVFSASSVAYAALTAAGTTTTGLTVHNPPNSNKNLFLLDAAVGFTPVTLATVAVTAVLGSAAQTATISFGTAFTPTNNLTGAASPSVAKAGFGSTSITNTPTGMRILGNCLQTVLTTSGGANSSSSLEKDEIAAAVIVQPGNLVTVFGVGTVADATSMQTITWAELPI